MKRGTMKRGKKDNFERGTMKTYSSEPLPPIWKKDNGEPVIQQANSHILTYCEPLSICLLGGLEVHPNHPILGGASNE